MSTWCRFLHEFEYITKLDRGSPCSHERLCLNGTSEVAICTLELWTHDDIQSVVAILRKRTQRINHWSTHMCNGSCEELALADGETQATDTP